MQVVYKVNVTIMTELQFAICTAIPPVSCAVDMINITARRVWLEKEIKMLAERNKIIDKDDATKQD